MERRNIFCLTRSNICNSSPTQYEKKLTSQTSSLTNRYENTDWKNSIYICMEFCQKFSNIENIYIGDSTIIIKAKKQRTGERKCQQPMEWLKSGSVSANVIQNIEDNSTYC